MKSASRVRLEKTIENDQPKDRCSREHGRHKAVPLHALPNALTVRAHGAISLCGCEGCPPLRYTDSHTQTQPFYLQHTA